MKTKFYSFLIFSFICLMASVSAVSAQKSEVLAGDALKRVIPSSFYFAGQSAETQMRNTAAVKFGDNHFVLAGLVDTSGYSTEISGKYEGFFITDAPVMLGDKELASGAYGFGFSKEGKVNIFDLSSKEILSVATMTDSAMKRPRPLLMSSDGKGVRFYKGKLYVMISPK